MCLSLIPVEERGNEILWKKKITWDTSICPKAVCLPHLAAGEYTVRKELSVPSQKRLNVGALWRNIRVEFCGVINAAVFIYINLY